MSDQTPAEALHFLIEGCWTAIQDRSTDPSKDIAEVNQAISTLCTALGLRDEEYRW